MAESETVRAAGGAVEAAAAGAGRGRPRVPLWRNRNFVLMWTSTAASGFGDRMIMSSALALLGAFGATAGSASINSQTQFYFVLPYVVLSLGVGWLADHLPRKWMLLFCDEARAGLLLLAATMIPLVDTQAALPEDQKWKVLALLTAIGCCAASFNPVRNAIVPDLMPRQQLQSANAVILTITVIASMVGQVVAPYLIDVEARATVRTALYLALGFYAASGLFFAFLKPRPIHAGMAPEADGGAAPGAAPGTDPGPPAEADAQAEAAGEEAGAGPRVGATRFLWSHPSLMFLIAVHAGVWGVAAAVYSGVLAVAKLNYGLADNELFGVFSVVGAGLGMGMLTGAVVVGLVKTRRESTILLAGSLAVAGLSVLLFAWSPNAVVGAAVAFLLGVVGNVVIITSLTIVQSRSPSFVRGRVMGVAALADNLTIVLVHLVVWRMGEASDRLLLIVMQVMGPAMLVFGGAWLGRYLVTGPMQKPMANLFWHGSRLFCLVWHRLEWSGRHHVPREGAVIIASNHTTGLDPFLIQVSVPRQVRWLMLSSYRFKSIEFFWKLINPVFIESDPETGARANAAAQVRQIVGHLKAGDCLGIFPEGHLQAERRELRRFQDGVAVTARLSRAQIVPCWIEGTARTPNMLRQFFSPGHRRVAFGEPFTADREASPAEVTQELRRRMLALASEPARREAERAGGGGGRGEEEGGGDG